MFVYLLSTASVKAFTFICVIWRSFAEKVLFVLKIFLGITQPQSIFTLCGEIFLKRTI